MSKVGLILSGGIAKGAYQVGALRAVQKYVDLNDVVAVSAASVGALNAFAYCGGRLELATKMWADVNKLKSRVNIYTLLRSDYLQGALNAMSKLKLKGPSFFLPVFGAIGASIFKHFKHFKNYKACKKGAIAGFATMGAIAALFLALIVLAII
jgi:predicted acylesterase/phospholipase RssA